MTKTFMKAVMNLAREVDKLGLIDNKPGDGELNFGAFSIKYGMEDGPA